jgi:triacylglycerol lipase
VVRSITNIEGTVIARQGAATVVVPIYPLAPHGTAGTVVPQMADLITSMIHEYGPHNVSIYGDSAGAGIALCAAQELVRRNATVPARGSLSGLPPTAVYDGSLEVLGPDAVVLQDKALATPGADFTFDLTFDLRKGEMHDWAMTSRLPEVRSQICHQLFGS